MDKKTNRLLDLLGADAIRNPAQTLAFYDVRIDRERGTQFANLGKRQWVREHRGGETYSNWKLMDRTYLPRRVAQTHLEVGFLVPLSEKQAVQAELLNTPPGNTIKYAVAVLAELRSVVASLAGASEFAEAPF